MIKTRTSPIYCCVYIELSNSRLPLPSLIIVVESILLFLYSRMIMGKYMLSLKEILKAKVGNPVIVPESSNVAFAIRTMNEYQVGSVMVQSQTGQPIGILTERDVIKLYAEGVDNFEKILIRDCMNTEMTVGHPSDSVSEVLAIMTVKRFRHMPVVEGSKMVGVVSIGDLVKAKLEEAVQEAQILRDYISAN